MDNRIKISIVGGSGYTGGELLRILLFHPHTDIFQVTSRQYAGKPVSRLHPNLRGITQLKFCPVEALRPCDVLFLALPHGHAMKKIDQFRKLAPKIIDLSADFRLNNPRDYDTWYNVTHPNPQLLEEFVYGIPEIHRDELKGARYVASPGCNATASILPLYPLARRHLVIPDRTVIEVKAGTSQGGNTPTPASHHPERYGAIRTYKPAGHRHIAEILQENGHGGPLTVHFSATSIGMVRGIHCVCHVFLKEEMDEKSIWKIYREEYGKDPFIRIIKDRDGIYRYPDPKILAGSNYCDIGFQKDPHSNRIILLSALDNLMKGAAGQAVQAFNIMMDFNESSGLQFPGLHPV